LRRIAVLLVQLAFLYIGICIIVALTTGNPINFALWNASGVNKLQTVENFVVAGIDKDGYRTDLILFCQYDLTDNSLTAMQIPRDTKVNNKRNDKKINSAYGSPKKTEAMFDELESIVGIRADKYVIVSFKAFRELIDAIGGVEVNVPMRMYYTDPYQNLTIDLYPGEQLLDGRRAEMFMRFRQNLDGSGYPDGDIGRNAAQRKFYSAVTDKLLSGKTVLEGSLRTYREETYLHCRSQLEAIGQAIAQETRCAVEVHLNEGYPAVWNQEELYATVCAQLGADAPAHQAIPSLAGEDFSFYQKVVPGVFFFLGIGNTPELHTQNFSFDDEVILPLGVAFLKKLLALP